MSPVAAGGFSSAAGNYARVRPTYARQAIGAMAEAIPVGPVLDVGAGTGILTGQLRRAGLEMHACEPLPEMLAHLRRALPEVPSMSAVAESLPVRTGTYGGVTIAQAFHWMDHRVTLGEVSRVLIDDGVLALVWNVRDESVGWVGDLTDLIERRSGGRPYADERELDWSEVVEGSGGFAHLLTQRWANPVSASVERIVQRVRSTSFVAMMDNRSRASLETEVRELLAADPEVAGRAAFDYPHTTVLHMWRCSRPARHRSQGRTAAT